MRKLDGCFKDSFLKYLDCGVLAHGCARAACESCKHSILIAFSCKRRALCPSCQAKRAVIFAEHLHEEVLLPHEDRQLIFTIPKRLRIYFRYDRSLLKHLYTAAWQTWQEFVRMRFPYGTPGAVMALHTAGDDENARLFLARYLKKSPVSLEPIHIKDTLPEPSVVYFKQQDDGDEL